MEENMKNNKRNKTAVQLQKRFTHYNNQKNALEIRYNFYSSN